MTSENRTSILRILLPVILTLSNFGCGGSSTSALPPPPAISIGLSPTSAAVQISNTQTFAATVQNDNANKGVSWSLTQNGTSCSPGCGTLSAANTASGAGMTYTAPQTIPVDPTATLSAASVTDPSKTAVANVVISPAPVTIGFTGSTGANLAAKGTAQFTVVVNNDPTNQGVAWSVSCPQSSCGTILPATTASGSPATLPHPQSLQNRP